MKKKIISLLVLFVLFTPAFVFAQYGLDTTAQGAGLDKYGSSVSGLSGNIIGSLLSMVGVIFFILTVYAGVLWMTARGQEDVIKKAQNTLIAAVIGLIITIGSYAITNFIFQSSEGGNTGGGAQGDAAVCAPIQDEETCLNTDLPSNPGVSCSWDENTNTCEA